MVEDLNFRQINTLLHDGYSAMIELGDIKQQGAIYRGQCIRVTTVSPSGDTAWEIFRGSSAAAKAGKWLTANTNGVITSVIPF